MGSLAPTSIKNLPPELLARIFQFTHDNDHCLVTRESGLPDILENSLGYLEQPHTLSHVCSAWRRIALATPSFWSHIDIAIDHELNPQLFTRAKIYAQRAGRHALEIHFIDPGSQRQEQRSMERWHRPHLNFREFEDLHEFEFLDASTFIRSLVVEIYVFDDFRNVHFSAIEYFLANCTPGALTHYTTRLFGEQQAKYFDTSCYSQERISDLEQAWGSIQVLHLDGLGPCWESKLYHGLVDLRLEKEVPSMTITQLVDILKASPGLRILHLNNRIEFEVAEGTTVAPVRLDDLEVLNIEYYTYSADFEDDELLQWIQPGIKPLRFTFFGIPMEETVHFFKRSNVTRFYSAAWGYSILTSLLREAPRLKTLVLSGFHHNVDSIGVIIDPTEGEDPPAHSIPITIDTLHLMSFRGLRLGDIQEAVDRYSIQKIFLWNCCLVYQSSTDKKETTYKDETFILQKLSEIKNCPVVECLAGAIYSSDWE